MGLVETAFSGRLRSFKQYGQSYPEELLHSERFDGNYLFDPPPDRGAKGYEIRLGKIVLEPGDTLTITVPNVQIQVESLNPPPSSLIAFGGQSPQTQITYRGPLIFDLSLPYLVQTQLYVSQFPAILRPAALLLENRFEGFASSNEFPLTWILLGTGILLLVLPGLFRKANWLAVLGWLLITISLFYGVRGSFGLVCVGIALYISQLSATKLAFQNKQETVQRIIKGITGFVIVALGVYSDSIGDLAFRRLSVPDLSPLTPLVLMITVGVFLAAFSLYDAFDKSLMALLILFAGSLFVTSHALQSRDNKASRTQTVNSKFGKDLLKRLRLAFGNRIVPIAIAVLIVFAIANDLSSTYPTEIQLSMYPLLSVLIIPLLNFVSVFLAFASIALLFVLVYPFLPSKTGYVKATIFALLLFLVFLFGTGTDHRLIAALPSILVGRVIYYVSVPMLIGVYFDINNFMQKENKRLRSEGSDKKSLTFQTASRMYLKNIQGLICTFAGILSLVAPTVYAFLSSEPVMITYFDLLVLLL
jgi:hypothetical protein